jgi:DNA-binding CsgD family transcriptional regulator
VVRICDRVGDARTLREEVLAEIGEVVGYDAYVWLLTDPETSVGSAPLADVLEPLLQKLPGLIRLKYLTEVNRWTALGSPVALLRGATGGNPSRSRLWHDLLGAYGIADIASVVFRDRFGCWAFLDLWRKGETNGFTEAEAAFLASVAAPVTTALRRCQANTFVGRPRVSGRPGPVVLLLSPGLEVLGQTPATHDYLRVLVPPVDGGAPVPASAYNVAAQLLAVEAGADGSPPLARMHFSDGMWLSLRAARIGDAEPPDMRNIAVTIEEAAPAERLSMFVRAFGLSAREAELLSHLGSGADTKEIARRRFLSEHTVQDHLKSIFSKTSTRNRHALLSRALGT